MPVACWAVFAVVSGVAFEFSFVFVGFVEFLSIRLLFLVGLIFVWGLG